MDSINQFFESIKERLKNALQEQQESELYLNLKEKYDSLTHRGQLLVKIISGVVITSLFFWYPTIDFLDSLDLSQTFSEKRETLKDLLKIEREYSTFAATDSPSSPFEMKAQLDQKILAQGIKVEQIKDTVEVSENVSPQVQSRGILYEIRHLTVRQVVDLSYDLEQADKSLRVANLEMTANQTDPHYYDLKLKLINFKAKATTNAK